MTPAEEEGLDLSPLDPTRDPVRFGALARSVAARASARQAPEAWALLWRFGRPSVALAAVLALAVWGPLLWPASRFVASDGADPAEAVLEWARAGTPSSAAEVLQALGRRSR
jgi:hypothetical protein